jgi:hypothetical protein
MWVAIDGSADMCAVHLTFDHVSLGTTTSFIEIEQPRHYNALDGLFDDARRSATEMVCSIR